MLYNQYDEIYFFDIAQPNPSESIVEQLFQKDITGDYTFYKTDGTTIKYSPQKKYAFYKNSFIPKVDIHAFENDYTNTIKISVSPFKSLEIIVLILIIISCLFFFIEAIMAYFNIISLFSAIPILIIPIFTYFMPYFFYTLSAKKIIKYFDEIVWSVLQTK